LDEQTKLKEDIQKQLVIAKDTENFWRNQCNNNYQNHLDEECKLREAIAYLECFSEELKVDNLHYQQIIDEYSLYILNNCK